MKPDIWAFTDADFIEIISNGTSYKGRIVCITDVEEEADGSDFTEDSITILINEKFISFRQSEVELIRRIKN